MPRKTPLNIKKLRELQRRATLHDSRREYGQSLFLGEPRENRNLRQAFKSAEDLFAPPRAKPRKRKP